jgi:hypothetical protein
VTIETHLERETGSEVSHGLWCHGPPNHSEFGNPGYDPSKEGGLLRLPFLRGAPIRTRHGQRSPLLPASDGVPVAGVPGEPAAFPLHQDSGQMKRLLPEPDFPPPSAITPHALVPDWLGGAA